jgi:amidase
MESSKSDINGFLAARPELKHLKIEELHANGQYHKALDLIEAFVKGPSNYSGDPHYARRLLEQAEFQRTVASIFAKEKLDAIVYPTCQLLAPKTEDILKAR